MDKVLTLMPMALTIMVTGSMTNSMDSEWSPGQTEQSTKVTISTVKRKVKANSLSLMEVIMRENSNKMKSVVMESTTGLMENNMMENGVTIKCMERGHLSGKTRRNIKGSS